MSGVLNGASASNDEAQCREAYRITAPGVFVFERRRDYTQLRSQLTRGKPSATLAKFYQENQHHLEGALKALKAGEADIMRAFLMASWKKGHYGTQENATTLNGWSTGKSSCDGVAMFNLSPSYVRGCMARLQAQGLLQRIAIAGEGGKASKIEHFFLVSPKNIAMLFDFGTDSGERGWTGRGLRRADKQNFQRVVSTPIQVALYKIHDILDAAVGYGYDIANMAIKKLGRARALATEVFQCFSAPIQGGKRLCSVGEPIRSSGYFVSLTHNTNTEHTTSENSLASCEIDFNGEGMPVVAPLVRRQRTRPVAIEVPTPAPAPEPKAQATQQVQAALDPIIAKLQGSVMGAKLKQFAAALVRDDKKKIRKQYARINKDAREAADPYAAQREVFQQQLNAAADAVGLKVALRITAKEFGHLYKCHLKHGILVDLQSFLSYTLGHWERNARKELQAVTKSVEAGGKYWEPLSSAPNTADLAYRFNKLMRKYNNVVAEGRVVAVESVSEQQQEIHKLSMELSTQRAKAKRLEAQMQADRAVATAVATPSTGGVPSSPSGFRHDENGFLQPIE